MTTIALVVILYLMYSPTFLVDYLMNDEWANIGRPSDLVGRVTHHFFAFGRGFFGVYEQLVYGFVEYNPFRVQVVRFVNFASLAAIAVILLKFVEVRSATRYFAFFITLLFFSQPSIQAMMGYSVQLISNSQPSMWLSLSAFYFYFFVFGNGRIYKPFEALIVFLLLSLAMQSTQTYAFFSMVPLAYLTLTEWEKRKVKLRAFLLISVLVALFSSLLYVIGLEFLHDQGRSGYKLGEEFLATVANEPVTVFLRAINPLAYWSVFKLWSYPFPLHYTISLGVLEKGIAALLMVAWGFLLLVTIFTELRGSSTEEKRQIVFKWLTVSACLAFGTVFLIVESPQKIVEHRPHMTLTFVGIVILCAAYCLQVLASKYSLFKHELIKFLGAVLVLMIAFGAQAGVLRGIVNNRMEQLSFIRTELMNDNPSHYKTIIVVLPNWTGCITEPCGPWMGGVTGWNMEGEGVYRYALTTMGFASDEKKIIFVKQKPGFIPPNSIILDWNKYVLPRKHHLEYLRQN